MAAAQKLKDDGIFRFANGTATAWQNETIVSALGSSIMGKSFYDDLKAGKADFTDPRYVAALPSGQGRQRLFPRWLHRPRLCLGPAAVRLGPGRRCSPAAPIELANFKTQNPDIDLGVFAAPVAKAGDEQLVGLYFDGGYAVNAKTANKEAALKFLNFLASKDFGQAFANSLNNISPIPGVTFDNPLLQEVAELDTSSIPYMMLVDFRYRSPPARCCCRRTCRRCWPAKPPRKRRPRQVTDGIADLVRAVPEVSERPTVLKPCRPSGQGSVLRHSLPKVSG